MVKISTNIKNFIETITKKLFYTKTEIDAKIGDKSFKFVDTFSHMQKYFSCEQLLGTSGMINVLQACGISFSQLSDLEKYIFVIPCVPADKINKENVFTHVFYEFFVFNSLTQRFTMIDKLGNMGAHIHDVVNDSQDGFMSIADKSKLDGIVSGATKVTVDPSLSSTSTNPVQNKVINTALNNKAGKSTATTSSDGLMSSNDKQSLDILCGFASNNGENIIAMRVSNIVFVSMMTQLPLDGDNKVTMNFNDLGVSGMEYHPINDDLTFYTLCLDTNESIHYGVKVSFDTQSIILDFSGNQYTSNTINACMSFQYPGIT